MRSGFLYFIALYFAFAYTACRKDHGRPSEILDPPLETSPPAITPVTANINEAIGGYYKALPSKYKLDNKTYPLLIFIHGGGGFGNGQLDLPILLNEGIPQLLDEKIFPPEFVVNGNHYSFIHLAPQFKKQPSSEQVLQFIHFAVDQFRVDTNRIFIAGMSNGGKIACDVAAAYPEIFAAAVSMAGVSDSLNRAVKCSRIAKANLPLWVFHNDNDQVISIRNPSDFISLIESFNPAMRPRFTIFPSEGLLGHDAWTRATQPAFREDNRNIYEWMLQYHRSTH